MSKFKHTCKYEQIDEYTFKCSICGKEKMPKELVKDLERQLKEVREALRDFSKAYSENFNTTQLLVKHIKVLGQLKEKGDE